MNAQEATAQRVQEEFATICGHLNVLHARMVELVADALEVGAWAGAGLRSPEHWLAWQTGVSPTNAKRIVDVARRRAELPVTFGTFANGELTLDQVAVVVTYADPHVDAEMCELAKNATVNQLGHVLARFRYADGSKPNAAARRQARGASPSNEAPSGDTASGDSPPPGDPPEDEASPSGGTPTAPVDDVTKKAIAEREAADRRAAQEAQAAAAMAPGRLSHGFNDEGRFYLHLELPADEGAVIDQALKEAHDRLFRSGRKDVSWADAMVDVAHRSLGAIESPDRRDQYRTYIHLDTEGTWLNNGPAIPRTLFEKLTCDGVVRPLWETEGLAINVGRKQHAIPAHTRRVVLDRDRVCRYPGCPNNRHLEVHHVLHCVRDCGPTDTWNLAAHCPFHHDAIHGGRCTVEGNADVPGGLIHRLANGRVIIRHNKAAPPGSVRPPGPPPGHEYQHPLGEPIHYDTVWFASPPPDDVVPTTEAHETEQHASQAA